MPWSLCLWQSQGQTAFSIVTPSPNVRMRSRYSSARSNGHDTTTARSDVCASSMISVARSVLSSGTLFTNACTTYSMECDSSLCKITEYGGRCCVSVRERSSVTGWVMPELSRQRGRLVREVVNSP